MQRYRRLMSEMANANRRRQGRIDRQLERLGEEIAEKLSELSPAERDALDCWQDGVERGFFEVDIEALMERPYRSIRRIDRRVYEYDTEEQVALKRAAKDSPGLSPKQAELLQKFLRSPFEDPN